MPTLIIRGLLFLACATLLAAQSLGGRSPRRVRISWDVWSGVIRMLHLLLKFSVLDQPPHYLGILRFMLEEHVIQLYNELIS